MGLRLLSNRFAQNALFRCLFAGTRGTRAVKLEPVPRDVEAFSAKPPGRPRLGFTAAFDVEGPSAERADKMVVLGEVGVVPCRAAGRFDRANLSPALEHLEIPVNRSHRNPGKAAPGSGVDPVRRRVDRSRRDQLVDDRALAGIWAPAFGRFL